MGRGRPRSDGSAANAPSIYPTRVEKTAITLNIAGLFQGTDPAQTGGRRDAHPPGQFHIGDSAVGLDLAEDFQVDFVKALRHAVKSRAGEWQGHGGKERRQLS